LVGWSDVNKDSRALGDLSKRIRQRKKVPPAHVQRMYLEEPIRLPSPPRNNISIHPSIPLSVQNTKKPKFLTMELKLGYPCGDICPLSFPSDNTYSYVQKENSGSTRKSIKK
jgi:hypothetical protein